MLLVPMLAGCVGPEVPDDAIVLTDPALPGLQFEVWIQEVGHRIQLHGMATNTGDKGHWLRLGCGHPWETTLLGPDGQDIGFIEVLEEAACAPVFDILQPGQSKDILYSWDYRDHDRDGGESRPIVAGTYHWSLAFAVRDSDVTLGHTFQVVVAQEPTDFALSLQPGRDGDAYVVAAAVTNRGAETVLYEGCGTEWASRILDANQHEVPLEPMFQCLGFQSTTFEKGATRETRFSWNTMVWDAANETASPAAAGDYTWEITFQSQGGNGGGNVTQRAAFTVN